MAHTITINISDADYQALQYVAVDPDTWVQNMVSARVASAKTDIQKVFIDTKTANGESIPGGGIDAQVVAAYGENIVKTAAQRNAEAVPPGV